jgi:oligoribonuclease NrnB/cAMP/cGMP phosphodiesterase (DHH superfamily)
MDDALIDSDTLPLSRKSVLPGTGFFYPDSLDEDRADERAAAAIDDVEAVVVADTDADGLGCVALLREAFGRSATPVEDLPLPDPDDEEAGPMVRTDPSTGSDGDEEARSEDEDGLDAETLRERSTVGFLGSGPGRVDEAFARVVEYAPEGVAVYVCDLCPDEYEAVETELESVVDHASEVRWFDHHRWTKATADAVRAAGVDLVVGASDEECTTDVTLRSVDYDFPVHLAELALVTRDHDLWIKEDDRSDDVADYAFWVDAETYVETVRTHGPDLPPAIQRYLQSRREEKAALIHLAVGRAELRTVGPWTVGVTYGRCSQNEVAERLREDGADAAVVVKPAGSASIRGSETFERAHEVARLVGGGGHPRAAGCKPDLYDDMLDYAHHWTTRGAVTKRTILDAFRTVAADVEGDEDERQNRD